MNDAPDRRVGRQPLPIQVEDLIKHLVMGPNEGVYLPVGVGSAQNGEYREQQNVFQFVAPALPTTMILDLA